MAGEDLSSDGVSVHASRVDISTEVAPGAWMPGLLNRLPLDRELSLEGPSFDRSKLCLRLGSSHQAPRTLLQTRLESRPVRG